MAIISGLPATLADDRLHKLALGASDFVLRIVSLLVLALTARLFPEQEFATYVVFLSSISVTWVVAQLGTSMFGVRKLLSVDHDYRAWLILSLLGVRVLLASTVGGFLFVLWQYTFPNLERSFWLLIAIILVSKACTLDWALRALRHSLVLASLIVISACIQLTYVLYVSVNGANIWHVCCASAMGSTFMAISTIVACIFSPNIRKSLRLPQGESYFRESVSRSAVIGTAGICVTVSQNLPILMLNYFGATSAVAVFGGLQRILQMLLSPSSILSLAHFPFLSQTTDGTKAGNLQQLAKVESAPTSYLTDLFLVASCGCLLLMSLPDLIPRLVLGDGLVAEVQDTYIVAAVIPIFILRTFYTDTAIARGYERNVVESCLFSLVLVCFSAVCFVSFEHLNLSVAWGLWTLALGEAAIIILMLNVNLRQQFIAPPSGLVFALASLSFVAVGAHWFHFNIAFTILTILIVVTGVRRFYSNSTLSLFWA